MILLKTVVEESFEYYRKPVMLLAFPRCNFKCCVEAGIPITVCQNEPWYKKPNYEYSEDEIIKDYLANHLTEGICCSGMEPMDSFDELLGFLTEFRKYSDDVFIVFTGFTEGEKQEEIEALSQFKNVIVKFGRFRLGEQAHYDEVLGVTLASDNQYAKKIS